MLFELSNELVNNIYCDSEIRFDFKKYNISYFFFFHLEVINIYFYFFIELEMY
jgi:hypothetical protein